MRCSHPITALPTVPHPPGSAPHTRPPIHPHVPRLLPNALPDQVRAAHPGGESEYPSIVHSGFSQSPAGVGLHRDYSGLPARAGIPRATRRALAAPPRSSPSAQLSSNRVQAARPMDFGKIPASGATRWVLDGGTPPCLRGHIAPRLCTPPCRPLVGLGRDFWAFAGARRCDTCTRRDGARRRASKKRAFRPASGQRATMQRLCVLAAQLGASPTGETFPRCAT